MSVLGFVYMLHNECMTVVKIGCTERSPHARAEELSAPTGIPIPFQVACYVELRDFQAFERRLHNCLRIYRTSMQREFFSSGAAPIAARLMLYAPGRLSFSVVDRRFLEKAIGADLASSPDPWMAGGASEDGGAEFNRILRELEEPF